MSFSHSSGDRNAFSGIGWYRKHFKLPVSAKDGKVFLEFEGLKQAGRFFFNGKPVGKFENGITACGLDISGLVRFGDSDNVLALLPAGQYPLIKYGSPTGGTNNLVLQGYPVSRVSAAVQNGFPGKCCKRTRSFIRNDSVAGPRGCDALVA